MHALLDRLVALPQRAEGGASADRPAVVLDLAREVRGQLSAPTASTREFFRDCQCAIDSLGAENADPILVQVLLDIAQYYYVVGHSLQGIEAGRIAVDHARALDDHNVLRRALNTHGILQADAGNIPVAIESYSEALGLAIELSDPVGECSALINIGNAFILAGQYQDAIECFERCLALADEHAEVRAYREIALSNLALACLHLEDLRKGLRAAKQSVEGNLEPKDATEMLLRVNRENIYAQLLLQVDSLERAKERCEIAKQYAAASHSERAELAAALAEGLYEVHAGMLDVGISRLTRALDKARNLNSNLREALVALVRAHEIAGNPERALSYLRELLLHTRKSQQENVLLHHRLHLEKLDRESGEDKPASTIVLERREALLRGQLAEQELIRSRVEMLERLAVTAELRDDSTGLHSYRVGRLAALLAAEHGCDEHTQFMVDLAARLHDIGKIGIPDGILLKPDRLNPEERRMMETHTTVGADLLTQSNVPHVQMAVEIARHHHEWWDGSGYPAGLAGDQIPLTARMTALADVFDALTHRRPYKEAWPVARALEEIAYLRGTQFDPVLTDLFLKLIPRLQREFGDIDEYLAENARQSPFIQARQKISATLRRVNAQRNDSRRIDTQR